MPFNSPKLPAYAELQTTTNFSFLRGGSHAEELVAAAKALGLAGLAITDRNSLAGVVRAHAAAKDVGLRLIVGARLDLTASPGMDGDAGTDRDPPPSSQVLGNLRGPQPPASLLCLPTDRAAYGRLCQLLTLGQRRAAKGQCTLFLEDVAAHSDGQILIALPPDNWDWRTGLWQGPQDYVRAGVDGSHDAEFRLAKFAPSSPSRGGDKGVGGRNRASRRDHALMQSREFETSRQDLHPTPTPPRQGEGNSHGQMISTGQRFLDDLVAFKHALPPTARLYLAASHTYRGDDRARVAALAHLAEHCGIPLVATGDVLYHAPHRRPLQDVLTCIREKCTLTEAGFRLQANAERHLKSASEMARLFAGHEDALARTLEVLQACRFSLDQLVYEYPDEPVPSGATPQLHLESLTWAGAAERYPLAQYPEGVPGKIRDVLNKELSIIAQLDYAPYFLTVHDIVRYARSQEILCQGRGSAANSAVCYCLGITNVNPIEVDLLFERFITPERKEPPDIDVDFEHERREEVIQYIYRRYGRERAGLAATVISYRSRSAVREVGKVMGLSQDTVAALAGMVWGSHSGDTLPERHVREAGLDPGDPRLARVLELTRELTGFPRHLSQHVGGFVLTRSPLSTIVPIGNAAMADRTCIEWDKDDLDTAGLLKVDVLGLGMLSCIRRAFDLIARHHQRPLTLATVPREDAATYDMLCRADSIGVFQVESRAQMNMLPRLKPRCFYDLVIEVAIVRPGPIQGDMVHPYLRRRDGLEPEHYPSPDPRFGPPDELRQILGKTKGVPLFQEQAMRIAMDAAKFTADEVNQLRKALATFRRRGTIGLLEEKMVSAMVARGYERTFAERCFNQIKGFGEYGFPESHAASFAHLVYVSAWLKCHYPHVFAAALLNSQPMGFYAPAQIVRDAIEHGVEARTADINFSDWDCTLEEVTGDRLQGTGKETENRKQERRLNGRQADHARACPLSPVTHPLAFTLRLGLRQIDGIRQDEVEKIVAVRNGVIASPFRGEEDTPRVSSDELTRSAYQVGVLAPSAGLASHLTPHPSCHAAWASQATAGSPPPQGGRRQPFRSIQDLWARAGVQLATLEKLAAADAFRSLGLDRRQALWEVKALGAATPLPLFEAGFRDQVPGFRDARKVSNEGSGHRRPLAGDEVTSPEPWNLKPETSEDPVQLPLMSLSEHVVADYQTTRLSLKAHPMSFLRARLDAMRVRTCAALKDAKDGSRVSVAGIVLVRQRPGSAKGVVFMTLEDETGIANAVIWPKTLERFRRQVMGARLVHLTGRIQRHDTGPHDTSGGQIIHVVAQKLEDRSDWLNLLSDDGNDMPVPIANADEVRRPDPGSAREKPADQPARRHPRDVRVIPQVIPKSRDFH